MPVRRADETNFRVRNCRIFHLKSLDHLGLLVVFFLRRYSSLQFNHGGIGMNNKLLSCLIAGALSATLALASPVLARGGGWWRHGGAAVWEAGCMAGHGRRHACRRHGRRRAFRRHGRRRAFRRRWPGFSGSRFAQLAFCGACCVSPRFSHPGFSPRFSRSAFRDGFHHRFFHHRLHRFAFIGAPYAYAAYDSCWRRVWTPYGLRWVNVCGDYGY